MTSSRRQLLSGAFASAALSGCLRHRPAAAVRPAAGGSSAANAPAALGPLPYAERPRYVVQITLAGGLDSILSIDPKDQSAVGGGIDCGYRADQRVQGARRLFGPLIGELVRHDGDLCLVHGARVDTVSHDEGYRSLYAGRISWQGSGPAANALAERLPGGAPVPAMLLSCDLPIVAPVIQQVPSGDFLAFDGDGGPLMTLPANAFLEAAGIVPRSGVPWAQLFDGELEAAALDPSTRTSIQARIDASRTVLDLMARTTLPSRFAASPIGGGLSVALDAIRSNVARHIEVVAPDLWLDSHTQNYALQEARLVPLFADIAGFLDALKHTRNPFGPLSEQTTVLVLSEIGRYPKVNHSLGKDHFPELSCIFFGAGIARGVSVGETSPRFQSLPIDPRSGKPDPAGMPLTIDAIYASLFEAAGVDPSHHGYRREQVIEAIKG